MLVTPRPTRSPCTRITRVTRNQSHPKTQIGRSRCARARASSVCIEMLAHGARSHTFPHASLFIHQRDPIATSAYRIPLVPFFGTACNISGHTASPLSEPLHVFRSASESNVRLHSDSNHLSPAKREQRTVLLTHQLKNTYTHALACTHTHDSDEMIIITYPALISHI